MNKFIIFLTLLGLAYGSHFLEGSWIEDQYERENLNNFMVSRGVSLFKRLVANTAYFELEQEISKDGNTFTFSGISKFLNYLTHGHLYRWTENSFPFFLYLKPVEISKKCFNII